MERLWAPWRMTYLERPRDEPCVFCSKPEQSDEEALIVHRGEHCYVVLNLYPYGSGHLMIVPFRHVARPGELGGAAGAGIADHLHLHVVPRWRGDTNYLPVLADVRVMPQLLAETREALVAAWDA